MEFKASSVDDMFNKVVDRFNQFLQHDQAQVRHTGILGDFYITNSRNGKVLVCQEPVTLIHTNPRNRVLFNSARDANPFFHLVESIWMLSGSQDINPLHHFVPSITNFSDDYAKGVEDHEKCYDPICTQHNLPHERPKKPSDSRMRVTDETFHGAYGYRWRHQFGWDQIESVINELSDNPNSRRCVIQMWDASDSPIGGHTDTFNITDNDTFELKPDDFHKAVASGLDVPCNLCCTVQIKYRCARDFDRTKKILPNDTTHIVPQLDLTVYNRSNDLIWGMLGANVVQFSMLQEHIANSLGIEIGHLNQVSSNTHIYEHHWSKLPAYLKASPSAPQNPYTHHTFQKEEHRKYIPTPPHNLPHEIYRDLIQWVSDLYTDQTTEVNTFHPKHLPGGRFITEVFIPMVQAHWLHKQKKTEYSIDILNDFISKHKQCDWTIAGTRWLKRRLAKQQAEPQDKQQDLLKRLEKKDLF